MFYIFLYSLTVGCPIPHFSVQKGARERPLCGRYAPLIRTGASSEADLNPTVKAALLSADSEEDREGLGCHLGQGLNSDSITKWLTPNIGHYKVDRERFRTQLMCAFFVALAKFPKLCPVWLPLAHVALAVSVIFKNACFVFFTKGVFQPMQQF